MPEESEVHRLVTQEASEQSNELAGKPSGYEYAVLASNYLPDEDKYSPDALIEFGAEVRRFLSTRQTRPQRVQAPAERQLLEKLLDTVGEHLLSRFTVEEIDEVATHATTTCMNYFRTGERPKKFDFSKFDPHLNYGYAMVMFGDMERLRQYKLRKLPSIVRYNSADYVEALIAEQSQCEISYSNYLALVSGSNKNPRKGIEDTLLLMRDIRTEAEARGIRLGKSHIVSAAKNRYDAVGLLNRIQQLEEEYKGSERIPRKLIRALCCKSLGAADHLRRIDGRVAEVVAQMQANGLNIDQIDQTALAWQIQHNAKQTNFTLISKGDYGELSEYTDDPDFTPGILEFLSKQTDPESAAASYRETLTHLQEVSQSHEINVQDAHLRTLALGGQKLSAEGLIFEDRVNRLRHQSERVIGYQDWIPRLIAKAYPAEKFDIKTAWQAQESLCGFLRLDIMKSMIWDSEVGASHVVDEKTCRVVYFSETVTAATSPSDRKILAGAFGLEILLYGEDTFKNVQEEMGENWDPFFDDLLTHIGELLNFSRKMLHLHLGGAALTQLRPPGEESEEL